MNSESQRPKDLKSKIHQWYTAHSKLFASVSIAFISIVVGGIANLLADSLLEQSASLDNLSNVADVASILVVLVAIVFVLLQSREPKRGDRNDE